MTVKEEIQLRLSGVTSAEIKDMKEREKLENNPPADDPKDNPPADDPKDNPPADNVSRETLERLEALEDEKKKLEAQLSKLQEENTHRDLSGNEDQRSDFDKCVDIFKGSF